MHRPKDTELLARATALVRGSQRSHVTQEFLKRRLELSVTGAQTILHALLSAGIVGPRESQGHRVLPSDDATSPSEASVSPVKPRSATPPTMPSPDLAKAETDGSEDGEQTLTLDDIRLDQATQVRAGLNDETVQEYVERLEAGDVFPAVAVFHDNGTYLLADGFHRIAAYRRANLRQIRARVYLGSLREAVLFALQANLRHGLPLTREEKRQAAISLLSDPEWAKWSDQEIGRHCGLSGMTVSRLRTRIDSNNVKVTARKCRSRGGSVRTMNVAGLGRKRSAVAYENVEGRPPEPTEPANSRLAASASSLLAHLDDLAAAPPDALKVFVLTDPATFMRLRSSVAAFTRLLETAATVGPVAE